MYGRKRIGKFQVIHGFVCSRSTCGARAWRNHLYARRSNEFQLEIAVFSRYLSIVIRRLTVAREAGENESFRFIGHSTNIYVQSNENILSRNQSVPFYVQSVYCATRYITFAFSLHECLNLYEHHKFHSIALTLHPSISKSSIQSVVETWRTKCHIYIYIYIYNCETLYTVAHVLSTLKERLFLKMPHDKVRSAVTSLVEKSYAHVGTTTYDQFQAYSNGIVK
jgi:hypothetical protein